MYMSWFKYLSTMFRHLHRSLSYSKRDYLTKNEKRKRKFEFLLGHTSRCSNAPDEVVIWALALVHCRDVLFTAFRHSGSEF